MIDEAEKAESGSMSNIDARFSLLSTSCAQFITYRKSCHNDVDNNRGHIPTSSYGSTTVAADQCESEKKVDVQPSSCCAEQRQDPSVVMFEEAVVRKEPPLGRCTASTCN